MRNSLRGVLSLLVLLIFFLTTSCSRYEVKQDKDGRTIRLDHWTGDVTILIGDTLFKMKTPEEQKAQEETEKKKTAALNTPRVMPSISIPQLGSVSANLRTVWRDGTLNYQFTITPVSKVLRDARTNGYARSFTLIFYDDQGFKIKSLDIRLNSMSQTVDESGKPLWLNIDDSDFCTAENYERIRSWNVLWSGF
jgi:hypothetical protein